MKKINGRHKKSNLANHDEKIVNASNSHLNDAGAVGFQESENNVKLQAKQLAEPVVKAKTNKLVTKLKPEKPLTKSQDLTQHNKVKLAVLNKKLNDGNHHLHFGHRARLRQRFLRDEGSNMLDYEILELLLTLALPRQDTRPLAKKLLNQFGSFASLISAEPALLLQHPGVGEVVLTALKLVRASALRLLRQEISDNEHVISGWNKLLDYLYATMAREKTEQLRLIYLNHRFLLIADEKLQQGTINHTPFYVREILKRTLELSASHLVLVHNHPSGNHRPSADDIQQTKKLTTALKAMDVTLHDHIIISQNGHYSFKSNGLL